MLQIVRYILVYHKVKLFKYKLLNQNKINVTYTNQKTFGFVYVNYNSFEGAGSNFLKFYNK